MEPKTKILVVENEPLVALDLGENLNRLGYEVPAVTARGDEAFLAAKVTRPDLVLMDIDLDGPIDGIAAGTKIQAELQIPVVFLTAHDDMQTLRRAQEAEPFGYMSKPIVRVDLANSIEIALQRNRKHNEQRLREAWLEAQLTSLGDGLIATSHDGTIWFINPEGERLLGISGRDVIGKSFASAVPLRNCTTDEKVHDLVRLAFLWGEKTDIGQNFIVAHPANRRISGEVAVCNFEGEPIGAIFTFRDSTVEIYRGDAIHNSIVTTDNFDCSRRPVNLCRALTRLENGWQAKLPSGVQLKISVDESVYPVWGNVILFKTVLDELVGKMQDKPGNGGTLHISAINLDFERRHMGGKLARYVRLSVGYEQREFSPAEGLVGPAFDQRPSVDLSMARIQSALQALKATAHRGWSLPGFSCWEIDIPACDAGIATAAASHPCATVIVLEPDSSVRAALCGSFESIAELECLGAQDLEEAHDWMTLSPGLVDVVIAPDLPLSQIRELLEASPTTTIMIMSKEQSSTKTLLEEFGSSTMVIDHLCSHRLLQEQLRRLLDSRASRSLKEGHLLSGLVCTARTS